MSISGVTFYWWDGGGGGKLLHASRIIVKPLIIPRCMESIRYVQSKILYIICHSSRIYNCPPDDRPVFRLIYHWLIERKQTPYQPTWEAVPFLLLLVAIRVMHRPRFDVDLPSLISGEWEEGGGGGGTVLPPCSKLIIRARFWRNLRGLFIQNWSNVWMKWAAGSAFQEMDWGLPPPL